MSEVNKRAVPSTTRILAIYGAFGVLLAAQIVAVDLLDMRLSGLAMSMGSDSIELTILHSG